MTRKIMLIIVAGVGVALITFIGVSHIKNASKPKTVVDTIKTETKKLPPEFKKKIALASPSSSFRVPVLMYHYVENITDKKDTIRQSLNIPPSIFEEQVKTLKGAGYTFLMAKDLADIIDGKAQLPPKPILLTFDDGHWDIDTVVLPILKKYNVKATSYIITGFTGGSDFMTKKQIQDVINSGLVEIGAHTVHHVSLKKIAQKTEINEVKGSKDALESLYHIPVVSFAYPNGAFDEQSVKVVENAGFTNAVSTVPGDDISVADRFFIPRIRPGRRTGSSLLSLLDSPKFKVN